MKLTTDNKILKIRLEISRLDTSEASIEARNQINIAWWALTNSYSLLNNEETAKVGKPLLKVRL